MGKQLLKRTTYCTKPTCRTWGPTSHHQIGQKRPTKETQMHEKRPTKEKYLYGLEVHVLHEVPLCTTKYVKRDLDTWKETKTNQKRSRKEIKIKRKKRTKKKYWQSTERTLLICRTWGPTSHHQYVKRDPNIWKETYTREQVTIERQTPMKIVPAQRRAHSYLAGIRIMSKETYIHEKRPTKETYIYGKCNSTKTHTFMSHRYSYHVKRHTKRDLPKRPKNLKKDLPKTRMYENCTGTKMGTFISRRYSYHVKRVLYTWKETYQRDLHLLKVYRHKDGHIHISQVEIGVMR